MALAAFNVKVGAALGGGLFSSSDKGTALPLYDLTALNAAITTALNNAGALVDSTSDITAIQSAVTALALSIASDVSVVVNHSTVTTQNQLKHALRVVERSMLGSNLLT